REQMDEWIKSLLPPKQKGAWWDPQGNGKGYIIRLRWRAGGKQDVYPFARLGKREIESLRGKSHDEQRQLISDRLLRELFREGRKDVARRIVFQASGDQDAGDQDS